MSSLGFEPGSLVHVRQRRWIVEGSTAGQDPGDATLVDLACIDDDAQGQPLTVLWECEPDAQVIEGDAWESVGTKGFDEPEVFASYLNTRRWNCVTSTDPTLFQSPFRAGMLAALGSRARGRPCLMAAAVCTGGNPRERHGETRTLGNMALTVRLRGTSKARSVN